MSCFRILHTSDWHLGNSLHERSRLEEYEKFLGWLKQTIVSNNVDALLVSGDVFDTGNPGNSTEELYYRFLTSLNGTCCRNVIITAGNHDSPATLRAARSVLELLNVHVVASPDAESGFANEIIPLPTRENPQLIVCAAPYLRAPALQASLDGEKCESDEELVRKGTAAHFEKLKKLALEMCEKSGRKVPFVAMAHLYAAGAKASENPEAEYNIVGTLENVGATVFPPEFDYVALGHIHRPQKIGGEDRIRYSGSPLPMGFDEANREGSVLLVDFEEGKAPKIRPVGVPVFQKLLTISGDSLDGIREQIAVRDKEYPGAWVRVKYTGSGSVGSLPQNLAGDFEGTTLSLLQAKYEGKASGFRPLDDDGKDLSDFTPEMIFSRRLNESDLGNVSGKEEVAELKTRVEKAFLEILKQVQEGVAE